MEQSAFVFTILFMLLGPIKVVPAFAAATRGTDAAFKRRTAIYAALFATAICAFIAFSGQGLIGKYRLSPSALMIAGGMVLLVAALKTMFPGPAGGQVDPEARRTPMQVAMSPLATPGIVPPAGVAALLILCTYSTRFPGLGPLIATGIAVMMALDFVAMFFNDALVKLPGLMLVLKLLGSVLVFVQVALAIDTILDGVRSSGLFPG
jgi:multiple antibiotic resistance protein